MPLKVVEVYEVMYSMRVVEVPDGTSAEDAYYLASENGVQVGVRRGIDGDHECGFNSGIDAPNEMRDPTPEELKRYEDLTA